jgi:hypothetical protein
MAKAVSDQLKNRKAEKGDKFLRFPYVAELADNNLQISGIFR